MLLDLPDTPAAIVPARSGERFFPTLDAEHYATLGTVTLRSFVDRAPEFVTANHQENTRSLTSEIGHRALRHKLNALLELLEQEVAEASVDDLATTADRAIDFIESHGAHLLDLTGLSESAHPEHLALLLRASSSWKNEVAGWGQALELVRTKAPMYGLAASEVLFGLEEAD